MPIPSEQDTMKRLDREKKHSIRIKADENNPNYKAEAVYVNGVCYRIPVGEDVDVPDTIYKLLLNKGIL